MYDYGIEKKHIFTEEGSRQFLRVRDRVNKLLDEAGACSMLAAVREESGDSWSIMACVDRLVELEEIVEIDRGDIPGQCRIFVKKGA